MNQTVLGELLAPVARALAQIRGTDTVSRVLSMADFIGLGVLRHLQGMRTLREQVQSLLHWEPGTALRAPLARSTWSDALSSRHRRAVLQAAMAPLLGEARAVLPDRLAQFPALQGRPVYAMDGTYQSESAHYGRCTPRQGGEDNPKGHALLSFYDVRLGCPTDVHVDTRSRHETALLRDYDQSAQPMTRHKGALWLVDRAFIDAAFWDSRKKRLGMTLITRMKSSLCIESTEPLPVADVPTNEGVLKDLRITLRSSRQNWREHWLIIHHQGKSDLERSYPRKMKEWREPGVQFIILRDNDGADCLALKQRLVRMIPDNSPKYLVRIVCQELESWFLGDLKAVAGAYPAAVRHESFRKLSKTDPDRLTNASELMKHLTDTQAKISRAEKISKHMHPASNRSTSFQAFVNGLGRFLSE
ncbi:MAG: DUF4276 family protein [Candidatus Accumulibacter propinquus]